MTFRELINRQAEVNVTEQTRLIDDVCRRAKGILRVKIGINNYDLIVNLYFIEGLVDSVYLDYFLRAPVC